MFFDLAQASASGGLNNKKIYTGAIRRDITNLAAFLHQTMTSIISLPQRWRTLSVALETRLMISSATPATADCRRKAISADAILASVDYDNFLFNAGLLMHHRTPAGMAQLLPGRGAAGPGKYGGRHQVLQNGHLPLTKSERQRQQAGRRKVDSASWAGALPAIICAPKSRPTIRFLIRAWWRIKI